MGYGLEVGATPPEKEKQCDKSCGNDGDQLNEFRALSLKTENKAVSENQSFGFLPHIDFGGMSDSFTTGAKNLLKEGSKVAEELGKKIGHETAEAVKTIENVPAKDWVEIGKAALKVGEKDGAILVLDGVAVGATDGTNVLADAKLGLDLYKTATSAEGKELGHKIAEAWRDGEKNKAAQLVFLRDKQGAELQLRSPAPLIKLISGITRKIHDSFRTFSGCELY